VFLIFAAVRGVAGTHSARVRAALLPVEIAAVAALRGWLGQLLPSAAPAGSAAFALLCSSGAFEGDEPNTEILATAPALLAGWAAERDAGLLSGTALSVALLINPALVFATPAVLLSLAHGGDRRSARGFLIGLALPLAATAAVLERCDALADARHQVLGPIAANLGSGRRQNFHYGRARDPAFLTAVPARRLWATGLAGHALGLADARRRRSVLVTGAWTASMWLRVKVDGYTYPHHSYPALPGLAAGIAIGADAAAALTGCRMPSLATMAIAPLYAALVMGPQLEALQLPPWERKGPAGTVNGLVYSAASYLRRHAAPEDRVFVPGSEPAILWLSERRAPSRLFDSFPLLHHPPYVREQERTLYNEPPAFVCVMPGAEDAEPGLGFLRLHHAYDLVWAHGGARIFRHVGPPSTAPDP
jgi:hypothetical protein